MSSSNPATIGELFLVLSEMGFTEEQIQAAMQAGHFSVAEAADWLVQGQYLRHTLIPQPSQPAGTAFSAFNPPKEAAHSSESLTSPTDSRAGPSLVLRSPQSCSQDPPPPVESRIKPDKSDFEEKERQRVAQEVRAERRQKKQERELVLKRIAEDRRSLQDKKQTNAAADASPPSSEGPKLGGKIQTNVDNNCILMIRLPSGESMRERFPADAPLRSVVEHITGRHPSLPSFSLLQGFPRKRFGEAELACSLRSLGLTPNAALCIQTTPPETPQETSPAGHSAEPPPCVAPPQPPPGQDMVGDQVPVIPPPLPNQLWEEAVNYAGIPGVPPLRRGSHDWGQGQRLVPGDAEDPPIDVDMDQGGEEEPLHMPNGTAQECGYFIPPLIYIFLASLLPLFLYYCFHMFPLFIRCELFAHTSETADPGLFL